jgi:hypothetical protein
VKEFVARAAEYGEIIRALAADPVVGAVMDLDLVPGVADRAAVPGPPQRLLSLFPPLG